MIFSLHRNNVGKCKCGIGNHAFIGLEITYIKVVFIGPTGLLYKNHTGNKNGVKVEFSIFSRKFRKVDFRAKNQNIYQGAYIWTTGFWVE